MYLFFISIILISIILSAWTSYALFFQPSKSIEITNLIGDIYARQKSVVIDIIDLSKILVKDTNETISNYEDTVSVENDFMEYLEDNSSLDDLSITEDIGDNPLGIVIEPSLPEISEQIPPEFNERPLISEETNVLNNGMDMNS